MLKSIAVKSAAENTIRRSRLKQNTTSKSMNAIGVGYLLRQNRNANTVPRNAENMRMAEEEESQKTQPVSNK